jgi:AbrB family looped-hinge helix DNA binding protein
MPDGEQRTAQAARVQVVIGPKGRVVIPAELRDALLLRPGDRLVAYAEEGRLVMERMETVLDSIRQRWAAAKEPPGAGAGHSAVDDLIENRRAQAAREETRVTGEEEQEDAK